jgi:predicted ATPase
MIKTLQLHNFKAFQDTGEIEIKPITVLAGPNSGGKSSILQSLLLLKQTLETEAPDIVLNLDGRFLQFSGFDELTFAKPQLELCEVGYKIAFETDMIPEDFGDIKSIPVQSELELSFRYREVEAGKRRVVLDRFNMVSPVHPVKKSGPRLTIAFHDIAKEYHIELVGDLIEEKLESHKLSLKMAVRHFLPTMPSSSYLLLDLKPEKGGEYRSTLMMLELEFFAPLRDLEEELKDHLKYIGPLREEPRRAYLHSGSPSSEIGQRGEYAAQILWLEKDAKVQYLPGLYQEPKETTLLDAVGHAFESLEITQPIDVKSQESIVYQILFGLMGPEGAKQVTIADVGFGVSQLLPVVLIGVRSEASSLLLFEQPEIHLHPKLQANLADFFLRMALLGKRIVVETHSDHFINRLRRRIAEDPTDELRDKVNILFVRPPHDGQGATIEAMKVDRYGIIENWPPDFLPESADEAEAIFLASLRKRKED